MRPSRQITFFQSLNVYPAAYASREDIEKGDKILLPSSALQELYPMMTSKNKDPLIFCLKNNNNNKLTYCGVLEFVAEEKLCYIPNWMFKMLKFTEPGQMATVAMVPDLKKKGNTNCLVKLRPHLTKFIDLQNPKAILEYQLRNFTCLHEGDTITIPFHDDKYEIDILEIQPKNDYGAICLIEVELQVDFAPPLDYVEPPKQYRTNGNSESSTNKGPFAGQGIRVDEKPINNRKGSAVVISQQEEYDPRKHRIHRGVRKTSIDWTGSYVKLGNPVGGKK